MSQFPLELEPQNMLSVTHQQAKWHIYRHHDYSKAYHERPKSGWWPNSWKSLLFSQNSLNNPSIQPMKLPTPIKTMGFPGGASGKEFACQRRRCGVDLWVSKIPWRRKWHPTAVFLLGESHGQKSMVGYSPRCARVALGTHSLLRIDEKVPRLFMLKCKGQLS